MADNIQDINIRQLYCYVDYCFGDKNESGEVFFTKWKRIRMSEIDALRGANLTKNVFITIQQFKNDRINEDKSRPDLQFAPIYFDFDSKIDLDLTVKEVKQVINYFYGLGVQQEHIRVWFSGSKGFHICVTPELFGIKPHEYLTYIIKNACNYIADHLHLQTLDRIVYTIRRQWRLPGSRHSKTNLYCTELFHSDLDLGIDEIKRKSSIATEPLYDEEEYEGVEEDGVCVDWFKTFIEEFETQKELRNLKPIRDLKVFKGENPVCITDIIDNSIRKPGDRNKGQMVLAAYAKNIGLTQDEAIAWIDKWAKAVPTNLTSTTDARDLSANVKSTVKTVYLDSNYRFSCAFCRSLGKGTDKPIKCLYENCKFINPEDAEPAEPIKVSLQEATRASYIGVRIETTAMVAGKADQPFGVPSQVSIKCKPDFTKENSVCFVCGIKDAGGFFEFQFHSKNPQILGMVDTTEGSQNAAIRKRCGVPEKCHRHKIEVLNYVNVTEIMLVPEIEFTPEKLNSGNEYVKRRAFYVGHDVETNTAYNVKGYTYPHPKTQHLVHLLDEIIPLKNDIETFKPDQEMLKGLRKFQIKGFAQLMQREIENNNIPIEATIKESKEIKDVTGDNSEE